MDVASPGQLVAQVEKVLVRYARQNGWTDVPAAELAEVARRFGAIAARRKAEGATTRGAADGEPVELAGEVVAALTKEVVAGLSDAELLAAPAKHLVKGCFQAAPHTCRDEYAEVDAGGVCRRQLLGKTRERVSGAFCVDCPYWQTLPLEELAARLAQAWRGDTAELAARHEVYLPADFGVLRRIAGKVSFNE